jgi:hypothetical protein
MNDFVSRSEILPVDRVTRTAAAVPSIQATTMASAETDAAVVAQGLTAVATQSDSGVDLAAGSEEQLASAAEYARVHASIADILANMRATSTVSASDISEPQQDIQSLLPQPVIIIPLPPASRDMVERAEMLAKDIAGRAVLSRSAQAHVKPGMVEQILAAVD